MEEKKEQKRHILRSPSYPIFSLEDAIKNAKILWDKDHNAPIHPKVALEHLGFKSTSGPAARTLAALKKFDLITEKEERIILTQKAIDLVLRPVSDNRHVLIRKELALKPEIYRELYDKYNGRLPSNETLKIELIQEHGFNPNKVDGFLDNFRATIEFAGLSELEKKEEIIEKEVSKENMESETPIFDTQYAKSSIHRGAKSFNIPLLEENSATIIFQKFPLEKNDIDLLKKWFEVYAVALEKKQSQDEG